MIELETRRLDQLARRNTLNPTDLIAVQAPGGEMQAMDFQRLLSTVGPAAIAALGSSDLPLSAADGALALVYGDAAIGRNGYYLKQGAPGGGSWVRSYLFVGDKGDPGGNAMAVGPFNNVSGLLVPNGTDLILCSGYGSYGDGSYPLLRYDGGLNAAYVAANPYSSVLTSNGRVFRLAHDGGEVNSRHFGALGGATTDALSPTTYGNLPDDWARLQAAIDYSIANGLKLYTPKGGYKVSKPLFIAKRSSGGAWDFVTLKWRGDGGNIGYNRASTVITSTFGDLFVVGLQGGRGCTIESIQIVGRNTYGYPAQIEQILNPAFFLNNGVRDSRYSPHTGIAVDPFGGNTVPSDGGWPGYAAYYSNTPPASAGLVFREVSVVNTVCAFLTDAVGQSNGSSEFHWYDCFLQFNRIGVATTQTQARSYFWHGGTVFGSEFAFSGLHYGARNGPVPHIFGLNIGFIKYIFAAYGSHAEPAAKVYDMHAESFASLGFIGGSYAAALYGASFFNCHLNMATGSKFADVFMYANVPVKFDSCSFETGTMVPHKLFTPAGKNVTFENCSIGGSGLNAANSPYGGEVQLGPTPARSGLFRFISSMIINDGVLGNGNGNNNIDQIQMAGGPNLHDRSYACSGQKLVFMNEPLNEYRIGVGVASISLGSTAVTANGDGTATFLAPDPSIFRIGDTVSTEELPIEDWFGNVTRQPYYADVLGRVTAISGSAVTVTGVGTSFYSANYTLSLTWWMRFHYPNTGVTTAGSADITGVSYAPSWRKGDHIRGAGIPVGARVENVSGTTVTIDRAATASASGVRLYDADVQKLPSTSFVVPT
ncbi:hypothetical protein PQ455_10475 [Sphingomonas naphthae]|uniref:Pectate lyase superfamily protein domain-containing protein n=1 Tax=Sphingomonas naphthae TaxID=1813468 RepID=A0ABY7TG88_9SPHN|nr:hypothetical protein [Sphingomonas naphthae]WCT72073.1 hypothetical protein PQ455_10475 [Sphingomonas naphthae]